jgi:hypothetical protein
MSIIFNYNEFLTEISEKMAYEMLLESKVIYSTKFINILNKMKDNRLSKELLKLYSTDLEIQHNYIDISDEKDFVSFTPDRKVKELNKELEDFLIVSNNGRYLTTSDRNNSLFSKLGFDKNKYSGWVAEVGTMGTIIKEVVSTTTGNIWCLFQEKEGDRQCVLHKTSFSSASGQENNKAWSTSRNSIKVGKLVRAILSSANVSFLDKEIEEFVNIYKAVFDFNSNALSRFKIVSGDDISWWYNQDNYENGGGTLNNSCMASVSDDYFEIYESNPQIRMVILYDDNGTYNSDGEYSSEKIKGRCILWDITGNVGFSGETYFMDRIYTTHDSDIELFKQYAEKNGFWYKTQQDSDYNFRMSNGSETKKTDIIIKLNIVDCGHYPYLDTLSYINTETKKISNNDREISADRELRDTGGDYSYIDSDDY